MKKLIKYFFLFGLSLAFLSCQNNVSQPTPIQEVPTALSPQTQVTSTLETIVPASKTAEILTPHPLSAEINFASELIGSLFVGYSTSGVYVKIDFDNSTAYEYLLPKGCQILSSHQKAVCEINAFSETAESYIYDIPSSQRIFTFQDKGGRPFLTSSENIVVYAQVEREEAKTNMSVFDLKNNTFFSLGAFDNKESTLAIPRLSNSAKFMVGVDYVDKARDHDDRWYMMSASTMESEFISIPENIAATDSIEWSPNDALVSLVGFYRDDEDPPVGSLRCKKVALIYDPTAKTVTQLINVPEERCFSPIDLYRDSIWSPDASKLALILNQQDICVVHVSEGTPECIPISNYYNTDYKILSMAWSPDSTHIAFVGFNGEVQVYSIKDRKMFLISNTNNLSSSPIGINVAWSR